MLEEETKMIEINKYLIDKYPNYAKYVDDESYVYKLCKNSDENNWLIVLQKLQDTITNEDRKNVINSDFAKHRANKLKVIEITNINDASIKRTSIVNKFSLNNITKTLVYSVGEIVESDSFDENHDEIYSNGIHYFKTLAGAYFYRFTPKNYSGLWLEWFNNGEKYSEGFYLNGERTGNWIYWHRNGQKLEEGTYVNGDRFGHWNSWYSTGKRESSGKYVDGKHSGVWVYWNSKDQKETKWKYLNGKLCCS